MALALRHSAVFAVRRGARICGLFLLSLIVLGSPALAQDAPQRGPVRDRHAGKLGEAYENVESGNVTVAVALLDEILADDPTPTAKHAASLMRSMITGGFQPRQAYWRDRQVVDQVVLVDSERAFLAAIEQWTDDKFWPVLFDDDWLAPMFIEAFEPARVMRFEPDGDAGAFENDEAMRQRVMLSVHQHNDHVMKSMSKHPARPGLVAMCPTQSVGLGGLALARGRLQPIVSVDDPPDADQLFDLEKLSSFNAALLMAAHRWKMLSDQSWMGLTLAVGLPTRYQMPKEAAAKQGHTHRAVDDLLGRTKKGVRLAVVGRLMGPANRSVYQAMSSLFLQPQTMLLLNTYGERQGEIWQAFDQQKAADVLSRRYDVVALVGDTATGDHVRRITRPASPFDMIWINSSGGGRRWTIDQGGSPSDLPIGRASAVHMVHSYSLTNPWSSRTVAGWMIEGGAFWYYGSLDEPYLTAFNAPTGMSVKVMAGTPLAFAARKMPGLPLSQPWRLGLIGDPLYVLREEPASRVAPDENDALTPVTIDAQGQALSAKLRAAVTTGSDAAAQVAKEMIAQAEDHKPGDLRLAAWTLYRARTFGEVAMMSLREAERDPILAEIYNRASMITVRQSIARGDIDTSRQIMARQIRQSPDDGVAVITQWYEAMSQAGQRDEALLALRRMLNTEEKDRVKAALTKTLKRIAKRLNEQKP